MSEYLLKLGAIGFFCAICAGGVAQQPRTVPPKEVPLDAVTNLVERVYAPAAKWCLEQPAARVLVVGHLAGIDRHMSIFPMDEAGRVSTSTPPVAVSLPALPPSLPGLSNVAFHAATHPTLPLIYVFQDIVGTTLPPFGDPATNPVFKDLDRLLVYQIATNSGTLVTAVRGDWFRYGFTGDPNPIVMAYDTNNHRLYMPTLRNSATNDPVSKMIGYLKIDANGLPMTNDNKIVPPVTLEVGAASVNQGYGWMIQSSNRVAVGVMGNIFFWDMADRGDQMQYFSPQPYHSIAIAAHPNQNLIYSIYIQQSLSATELADGHPTLQPRIIPIGGSSLPVVMEKHQRIAIGAVSRVAFVNIDAEGHFTGDFSMLGFTEFGGTAMYYSPRFDRLYVVLKPPPPPTPTP